MLVWFCLFPVPLGVLEGLRLVIMALPGLFSYLSLIGLVDIKDLVLIRMFVLSTIYGLFFLIVNQFRFLT